MPISRKDRERQLKYASRQAKKNFSYFAKYDELTGVLACPGVRLRSLQESSYSKDYIAEMKARIYADRLERIDMDFQ